MTRPPAVTDHAVLRYLERVWGVDVAALRSRIAAEAGTGIRLGAAAVRRGRVRYVLSQNGIVVTVTPASARPHHKMERGETER